MVQIHVKGELCDIHMLPSILSFLKLGHSFCKTLGYDIFAIVSSSASSFGRPMVTRSVIVEFYGIGSCLSS